jgi:hypothetical protein
VTTDFFLLKIRAHASVIGIQKVLASVGNVYSQRAEHMQASHPILSSDSFHISASICVCEADGEVLGRSSTVGSERVSESFSTNRNNNNMNLV